MLNIKVGAPEAILTWLARHSPPDMPIEELEKIADERMYHAKTLFYQKSGHDRRLSTKNQVKLVR